MTDLISRQAAIDNIRDFWSQITCDFSKEWLNGMDEGFNHAVDVIELMETADAIPVEWIKEFVKREDIHFMQKTFVIDMVNQYKGGMQMTL